MALSRLVLALVASSLHCAAALKVGSVSEKQLLPGLTASWAPGDGEDDIAINLTWTGDGWIGIGFSRGTAVVSGTMFGAGEGGPGADLFVCSDTDDVRRIWAVNRGLSASAGDVVPDATCMFEGGQTTMSFTRSLATESGNQLAVTPGSEQMVIWAHASQGGQRTLSNHGPANRGGMLVDFGAAPGPAPTGAPGDSSGAVVAAVKSLWCIVPAVALLMK